MNLNEVKKHVFLHVAIYIGIGICLLLSLFAILIIPAKAQEQTNDITSTIKSNFDCPYGYNASGYCAIQTDNGGGVRSFNTRYNGVLNTIAFAFPYYFNANGQGPQTIDIYSTTNDFRNNSINVYCYSYENSPSQSNVSSCSFRFISQKHIQVIYPYDVYQWHEVIISSNNAITGISNYLIQKVTLTYDDGQQDLSGIIDNATSNTTDIINNNNSNSEQTQNAIFNSASSIINELANRCRNILDLTKFEAQNNSSINSVDNETGSISYNTSSSWTGIITDYIPINPNITYYYHFNHTQAVAVLAGAYDENYNDLGWRDISGINEVCTSPNVSVCIPLNAKYIKFNIQNTGAVTNYISNFFISTINSFCPYGSTTSKLDEIGGVLGGIGDNINTTNDKLDEQNDLQQQQNDYLMDNSDPTVDSSGIQNTINSVQTTNPLSYLLTLPTNLLSAIINGLSSNSCTDFEIGKFGHIGRHDLGTYTFKFPCINVKEKLGDSVYNTIDIFVSMGILVFTIVKLYNTISSYLTLGAEDEVKAHSHFLTPMDFLGNILGGNISGVGNSISSAAGGGNW